jgi:hypothetical protein
MAGVQRTIPRMGDATRKVLNYSLLRRSKLIGMECETQR